ncbi:DUF357 domain-containing protein [Candidatus Bathyarchaeota archaeon]|nr:DUF357 domain-containing protein [Candidatus Bathyarchaeota archaeon]MBS7628846.1 DUF357 domain-containing protein [Candidatus Bathyarchaeota archaeon]
MKEDVRSTAERYIQSVEFALAGLVKESSRKIDFGMADFIIDSVNRYLQDANYYLGCGREVVALASAAYAEGLLDALRILGLVNFTWRRGFEEA